MKPSFGMQTSARRRNRPRGNTPSWFTDLGWWLELEQELLRKRLLRAPFNVDPCGHLEAPVSREILRRGGLVFTAKENGLAQLWRPSWIIYANPDWASESMERWGPRLRDFGRAHPRQLALHGPVRTDTDWWHESIEEDRLSGRAWVKFEKGRCRYGWPGNPHGVGGDFAMFPSATVVWR